MTAAEFWASTPRMATARVAAAAWRRDEQVRAEMRMTWCNAAWSQMGSKMPRLDEILPSEKRPRPSLDQQKADMKEFAAVFGGVYKEGHA